MKILVLSDEPSKWLYDFYEEGRLAEYDLILSCGDLPANYLSFLVTFSKAPLLYGTGYHTTKVFCLIHSSVISTNCLK